MTHVTSWIWPRSSALRAGGVSAGLRRRELRGAGAHRALWVQTVPDEQALVALDVTESTRPREIGRLTFDSTFSPHWLALDEGGTRLVVNDGKERMFLVALDPRTGALQIDTSFRDPGATVPGVSFARVGWPHGATGPAVPHGSVFARP